MYRRLQLVIKNTKIKKQYTLSHQLNVINLYFYIRCNIFRPDCYDEETRIKRCGEDFRKKLDSLNRVIIDEINAHLHSAVENTIAGIRYFRVQHDGPRIKEVSVKDPLTIR